MKSDLGPLDPCCARRICTHSVCPALDDFPCADFVSSPEISGAEFKRACEIEEEMLLVCNPNVATSHAFHRGCLEQRSGLSIRRATLAFSRLIRYGFVARRKNRDNGYEWLITEKGAARIAAISAASVRASEGGAT